MGGVLTNILFHAVLSGKNNGLIIIFLFLSLFIFLFSCSFFFSFCSKLAWKRQPNGDHRGDHGDLLPILARHIPSRPATPLVGTLHRERATFSHQVWQTPAAPDMGRSQPLTLREFGLAWLQGLQATLRQPALLGRRLACILLLLSKLQSVGDSCASGVASGDMDDTWMDFCDFCFHSERSQRRSQHATSGRRESRRRRQSSRVAVVVPQTGMRFEWLGKWEDFCLSQLAFFHHGMNWVRFHIPSSVPQPERPDASPNPTPTLFLLLLLLLVYYDFLHSRPPPPTSFCLVTSLSLLASNDWLVDWAVRATWNPEAHVLRLLPLAHKG